jgi:peptide/nickel transport system substrate-binding protein
VRLRRRIAAVAAVAATLALAACTSSLPAPKSVSVTVAVTAPFTSYNPSTAYGATTVNQQVYYATNSAFMAYDSTSRLVADTSFGTVKLLGTSPLRVRYTVRAGVKWSDGSPVDASDLLLAWAANSGALNTPGLDPARFTAADGRITSDLPTTAVWFDGESGSGLAGASALPEIGADGRSITLSWDHYFVDWQSAFEIGVPAHVVGEKALGVSSATAAARAVENAITSGDTTRLAAISRTWNSAFNVRGSAIDPGVLVGNGPYRVSSVTKGGVVTLMANPRYSGAHRPRIRTVVIRPIQSGMSTVTALANGSVDVITPSATTATATALLKLPKITIASGVDASFDHLDLQIHHGRSGAFDDRRIRTAFLKMVPRQQIVQRIAGPLQEEAAPRSSFVLFPGTAAYRTAAADNGSAAYATVDLPGARALLRAAGNRHPTVCILFDPANPVRVAEFGLVRDSAARAGFRVRNCSSPRWATILGQKGAYDAALFGWRSTSRAVTAATSRLHSGPAAPLNYNFFASPKTDALLDRLAQTSDPADQDALLAQIDRLLFDNAYGLPLFQLPSITAYRTTVTGIHRSPFAPGVFWNIWDWRPTG